MCGVCVAYVTHPAPLVAYVTHGVCDSPLALASVGMAAGVVQALYKDS